MSKGPAIAFTDHLDAGHASIGRTVTLPADHPVEQRDILADIAERTPVTLAARAGTPMTTTLRMEERGR